MQPEEILQKHWGYTSFRNGQKDIVTAVLYKQDTIAILPTGGGKSICFQVPALMFGGTTLVVSPLISLMQDQVSTLEKKGISATFINSTLSAEEQKKRITQLKEGVFTLVYVSPEKLVQKTFQEALSVTHIPLVVIDEAHCISMWGKDFRPSYQTIRSSLQCLKERPVFLAVTATATPQILADIASVLGLKNHKLIRTPTTRDNLSIRVIDTPTTVIKLLFLVEIIQNNPTSDGIIYASTRKSTEYIATVISSLLPEKKVAFYHGGLESERKKTVQDAFISGETSLIAATNAFGMGVDKPDIRFVVHFDTPISVENYSQEIGRAGRDGKPAVCYTFYSPTDIENQLDFQSQEKTNSAKKDLYSQAEIMKKILLSTNCKAQRLARYFTNQTSACGSCSSCVPKKQLYSELTRAVNPKLFYALKSLRAKNTPVLTPITCSFLATLRPKKIEQKTLLPGLGTATRASTDQINRLILELNGTIHP